MKHTITHGLSDVSKARNVVEKAYERYQEKLADHNPKLTWLDENKAQIDFTVMRKTMSVTASVTAQDLTIEGKLPLLFKPFQGKIISVLESEVHKWVEREKADDASS